MAFLSARTVTSVLILLSTSLGLSGAQTIGDLVRDGPDFDILEDLLEATDLLALFDTSDLGYTVFAPTDAAFNSSNSSLLDTLLDPDWVGHASCVLAYHVVDSVVRSINLTESQELQTLNDDSGVLTVSLDPTRVNDVLVTTTDIEATNGLVHVIGGILTPKCINENITSYLRSNPEYVFLTSLLDTSELASSIDSASPISVFAPTNSAFESLDAEFQLLLQSDPGFSQVLLLSHFFGGNLYTERLSHDSTVLVDDVLGKTAFVKNSTDDLTINGIKISDTDILRENGVVNSVVEIIMPLFVNELIDRLSNLTNEEVSLDIFAGSLQASNFTESLGLASPFNETVPFTVLAPTDKALGQLTQASLERLVDPLWYYHNRQLWRHHIVVGFEASLETMLNLTYLEVATVENLTVALDSNQQVVVDGDAIVHPFYSNLFAVNGAVHTIDRVLIPRIYQLSILDVGESNADFSVLVSLAKKAKLDNTLDGVSPLTFFAPTDNAFAEAGITADTPVDETITRMLLHHLVEGNHYFSDLRDNETLVTLLGSTLTFSVDLPDGQQPTYSVEGVELLDVALPNNGIFYVLDKLLEAPDATASPTVLGTGVPSAVPSSSPLPTSLLAPPSSAPPSPPTSGTRDLFLSTVFSFVVSLLGGIILTV